jgi:peroxiredoxin
MNKFSIIAIAILITVASVYAATTIKIGNMSPDFTLMDSHDKTHSLSDFKGKYVVLEWTNFGCPFVKKHYDGGNMQSLQKYYTGNDVVWLSICSSADGKQGHMSNSEINEKIKDYKGAATAYLIDEDGTVGKLYKAKTTPHMYIIDPDGKLIYAGAIDDIKSTDKDDCDKAKNYVKNALEEALNGKEVSDKSTPPYGCSVKYK